MEQNIDDILVEIDNVKELNEMLGLTDSLDIATTQEEKEEIESEIQVIENKIDYADDHGLAKDDLINQLDNLYEDVDDDFGNTEVWGV